MKKVYFFLLSLLFAGASFAQSDVYLKINHQLGASPFAFNTTAMNNNNIAFDVGRLQYYISEITLIHDGGMETLVPNTWLLVDAGTATNELLGSFSITNLEGVRFGVGVDSAVNHLDPSTYAMSHPLAPQSPSMHWGWTAGYRFVAMEGRSGTSMNQTYQIHALEDQNYFLTTILTTGSTNGQDLIIDLNADYAKALYNIDVSNGLSSHGGSGASITVMENFRDYVFTANSATGLVADPANAGLELRLSPSPVSVSENVRLSGEFPMGTRIQITDLAGRIVLEQTDAPQTFEFTLGAPGFYLVSAQHGGEVLATRKLLVTQ